jgi:hypothetical protein
MLASDANNPEFAGAHNPDSRLFAQFYSKPIQNAFKSEKEGRPIFEDVVMVKIMTPGNNLNIIDTFARDDHKQRFPLQWAHFQNMKSGEAVAGTPLTAWPLLTAAQCEEMKFYKFFTVESIAHASDQQLQSIGMVAGMSGFALRERAQRFLDLASKEATSNADAEKMKRLEAENANTAAALAALQEQMAALMAGERKKPGRKAKVTEAA